MGRKKVVMVVIGGSYRSRWESKAVVMVVIFFIESK